MKKKVVKKRPKGKWTGGNVGTDPDIQTDSNFGLNNFSSNAKNK